MAQSNAPINILEVLDGAEFPASIAELVVFAEDNDASEDVLDLIQAMPDRIYDNIEEVNQFMNRLAIQEGEENIYSSEGLEDVREEPAAADEINIDRSGHQLKNWA